MIKPRQLVRKFLWILFSLIVFMIFAGLDWIPTLKDLNRLRREQRDEVLKIKNFTAMTSGFVFPDAEEKTLFAQNNTLLRRSLPQIHDDDAWLAMAMLELQARVRENRMASALILMNHHSIGAEFDVIKPGRPAELADWVTNQYWEIQESFGIAWDPDRYLWHGIFSRLGFARRQRLASCELAVALTAPLPALLDFINHISWGEARLEIVRLHLEPGAALPRAWLICRGNYLVRKPSAWAVKEVSGSVGDNLLIDTDSNLLWQKVKQEADVTVFHKELPATVPKPK